MVLEKDIVDLILCLKILIYSPVQASGQLPGSQSSFPLNQPEQASFQQAMSYSPHLGVPFTSPSSQQQLFFPTNQMQAYQLCPRQSTQSFPSNQSYAMPAFTLIPPMVVPYHTLLQNTLSHGNGSLGNDCYMMPRIVDFGSLHGKSFAQLPQQGDGPATNTLDIQQGSLLSNTATLEPNPASINLPTKEPTPSDKKEQETNENITETIQTTEPQSTNELKEATPLKLPSFAKFLESLDPAPKITSLEETW